MGKKILFSPWTKRALFLVCLVPAVLLLWRGFHGDLTANPVEYIEHNTGDWTIRFLLITLGVTPMRKNLSLPLLARYRRMLGLFAFFYGCVHLSMYLTFDQLFSLSGIWADVMKRPYITVGALGFVLMIPLAVTSTAGMVRRMGFKNWQWLHRLVYVCALAGIIHFYWLVKSDISDPFMYFGIWTALMLYRVRMWTAKDKNDKKGAARPVSASV